MSDAKKEEDPRAHVFGASSSLPETLPEVKGLDFDSFFEKSGGKSEGLVDALLRSYATTGFQATHFAQAVNEINRMLAWKLSDEPIPEDEIDEWKDETTRKDTGCRIFLGYTSNMISCGVRETIRFLAKHKMIDAIVTTGGGIEEDFIKCMASTYVGGFDYAPGPAMRRKGLNRTGNLVVPNDNYCAFEDWLNPILDAMLKEQQEDNIVWTPSKMIHRFGKEIDNPDSVYYWCYKNDIPVFCPAITDGSIGDVVYFHGIKNPGLIIDIAGDIRAVNDRAVRAKRTGQIILGGGLVKHHINNANLMRNGAHYSVFVNTGQEFDGSDSGARPDEALSWGKIHIEAKPVKVYADASLVFPLLVSQTFAKLQGNKRPTSNN